jgi:phosphoglycerol transferase MdoB-like AlkP superfamily enzyme
MRPAGLLFSELGYETLFIHGANAGSMGLDGLAKRLGFKRHISKADFELTKDKHDGVWGVYDEFTFQRANEEFRKMSAEGKPFFSVIYSLTSHSPYTYPSGGFEEFDDSVPFSRFLNSLKYSDYAIDKFFDAAEREEYFNNTLFVITGDHAEGPSTNDSVFESYRVPLLFYAPGTVEPGLSREYVSQVDIYPTVVELLRISSPFTSWGRSLLSSRGDTREILLPRGDLFTFAADGKMILSDLDSVKAMYDLSGDPKVNLLDNGGADTEAKTKVRVKAEALLYRMQRYLKLSSRVITENRLAPPP